MSTNATNKPRLYSYFRSSTSYRVRIALHLKKIPFEYIPIHLINNGGEHKSDSYTQKNPMAQVPSFQHGSHTINQSLAILNYIDEIWPQNPQIFPKNPSEKALVLEICELINSGIHPLQNLQVGQTLSKEYGFSANQIQNWNIHWMRKGAKALETILAKSSGTFCTGGAITAADLCLIPQVYNFLRYKMDLNNFPSIKKIYSNCLLIEAFQKAEPHSQPDTTSSLKK